MEGEIITRDYIQNFFRLSDSDQDTNLLNQIMSHLELKEYPHHSYIYHIGDDANRIFFVESGTVIVQDKDGGALGEIKPGRYFGEYSALTGSKRTSHIITHGTVKVYELDKETLLELTKQHPEVYGVFLQKVYAQSAEQYRKLVKLLNLKRGIVSRGVKKKITFSSILVNYTFVFVVFLLIMLFAPLPAPDPALVKLHPFWMCIPVLFMVVYMLKTQRALETLVISTLLVMLLHTKTDFIGKFTDYLLLKTTTVIDIILILLLMGSLTRLFSASGSINALRHLVQRKTKSAKGTFFAGFISMVLIAIDDHLSILINATCFKPLLDDKHIPREKTAVIMGFTPSALCILSPFSTIGIYLAGVIAMATGDRYIFPEVISYNFGAILMVIVILFLIIGKIPLSAGLKKAEFRVKNGGTLWPEGTEASENEDEDEQSRGLLVNLFLPVAIFIVSSIITGTLASGTFRVNVLYGLLITLIFVFLLYCFQQYMTPDQFFKHLIYGIEDMIAPVIIFTIGKCFAYGLADLGFTVWLSDSMHNLIGEQVWLLAPIIFSVAVLIGVLFNDHWAMYTICIPIAVGLASSFNGNIALCLGAVCSAGLLGYELALGNIYFIGTMLGVNPRSYYRAKLPYFIVITALSLCAFVAAGLLA